VTGVPSRSPSAPGAGSAERARLVAATAANLAGWHDLNLRALGHRTEWRDGWWLTPDDVPIIYFRAIAVRPAADPRVPVRSCHLAPTMAACDPWSDLPLGRHGLTHEADRPWMQRPAGPVPPEPAPDGVAIERVADDAGLVDFERTAAAGFGSAIGPPHTWHGLPLLDDGRFDLWLARAAGHAVGTANGFREAGVLGVYAVSTIPAARRRGVATALTARTVGAAAGLPAVLQPSEMAEPLYRRMGFERFTTFRTWTLGAG
jgi:hypothetical protein